MKKNNNAAWGMLVTLLGGILWGFSGTCGQYIFQQEAASSQWVTCVRMLGAGVVLIALGLAKQRRSYAAVWRDKKDAAGLLLFAVLGLMFSQYTYMTAISYSNSAQPRRCSVPAGAGADLQLHPGSSVAHPAGERGRGSGRRRNLPAGHPRKAGQPGHFSAGSGLGHGLGAFAGAVHPAAGAADQKVRQHCGYRLGYAHRRRGA